MIKLGPTGQFPQDNPDEIKERERAAARRDCRQASLLDPELDVPLRSVAIERLVEEVRNGANAPRSYNRVYNRHMRS